MTNGRDAEQPAPEAWAPDDWEWTHDDRRPQPRAQNQRIWPDGPWPPVKPAKRRFPWGLPALSALGGAAVAVAVMLLLGGMPGRPAPAGATASSVAVAKKTTRPRLTGPALAPPITVAAARAVLAGYTTAVNTADAKSSPADLAATVAQGSYSLAAGVFKQQKAAKAKPAVAYAPRSARFYIPLEPAAYPHWFAVRVANVTTAGTRGSLGTQYLVFFEPAAGAGWKEVDQPRVLGTAPDIALSPSGYATAVSPATRGFTVPPSKIARATASSLDGHGAVPGPGNLQEAVNAAAWRQGLPKGAALSLTHAAAGYPMFGLQTTGGGALLFYSDSARLVIKPARGKTLTLSVPGYYSTRQHLSRVSLGYLDQFAAYDPPASIPGLSIVADDSGIVS